MLRILICGCFVGLACFLSAQEISLATSKFSSLYGFLRNQMMIREPDRKFGDSLKGMRSIEQSFPEEITVRSGKTFVAKEVGPARIKDLYWRSIDVLVYSAGSEELLDRLVERVQRPIGGHLALKDVVSKVKEALRQSSKVWEAVWPKLHGQITEQQKAWQVNFAESSKADLKHIADQFGIIDAPARIEILLLPYTGGKEGMTIQTLDGWKVVIGAEKYQAADLAEVVLHESTHVLDSIASERSFLGRLRTAMMEAKRSSAEIEQVPHALIFEAAAAAISSREKTHVPVGKVNGAYGRFLPKVLAAAQKGLAALPNESKAISSILKELG